MCVWVTRSATVSCPPPLAKMTVHHNPLMNAIYMTLLLPPLILTFRAPMSCEAKPHFVAKSYVRYPRISNCIIQTPGRSILVHTSAPVRATVFFRDRQRSASIIWPSFVRRGQYIFIFDSEIHLLLRLWREVELVLRHLRQFALWTNCRVIDLQPCAFRRTLHYVMTMTECVFCKCCVCVYFCFIILYLSTVYGE